MDPPASSDSESAEDDSTWGPLTVPALPDVHEAALPGVLRDCGYDVKSIPKLYNFSVRICKSFLNQMPDDDMCAERHKILTVVSESVMHTVPLTDLDKFPFGQSVDKCTGYYMPVVENLFKLMAPGPAKGSKEWLAHLKDNIKDAGVPDVVGYHLFCNYVLHTFSKCMLHKFSMFMLYMFKMFPGTKQGPPQGAYQVGTRAQRRPHDETTDGTWGGSPGR